jgi:hypothetical protein
MDNKNITAENYPYGCQTAVFIAIAIVGIVGPIAAVLIPIVFSLLQ